MRQFIIIGITTGAQRHSSIIRVEIYCLEFLNSEAVRTDIDIGTQPNVIDNVVTMTLDFTDMTTIVIRSRVLRLEPGAPVETCTGSVAKCNGAKDRSSHRVGRAAVRPEALHRW